MALKARPVWPGKHSCPVRFSADQMGHICELNHRAAVFTFEGRDMRPSLGGDIAGWGPSALERTVFLWLWLSIRGRQAQRGSGSSAVGVDTGCHGGRTGSYLQEYLVRQETLRACVLGRQPPAKPGARKACVR